MNRRNQWAAAAVLVLGSWALGRASEPLAPQDQAGDHGFTVTDVMISAHDGVRLNTKIFAPRDRTESLPIIFMRTPYGIGDASKNFVTGLKSLADEGYIFVFQDIRGKFGSEGAFGVITEATLRVHPRAERSDELGMLFRSFRDVALAVRADVPLVDNRS